MALNKPATKSHLFVGSIAASISLVALLFKLVYNTPFTEIAILIFGVWGGVEIGRYLEFSINKKLNKTYGRKCK